jgi:hypothetical protein
MQPPLAAKFFRFLGYCTFRRQCIRVPGGLDLVDFSGGLVLPVPSLLQRPVKFNGPGPGTIIYTATAIPAFVRMQYDRRFAFLRIGHEHVYLADIYTGVAPIADIWIKDYRIIRCDNIRHGDYFFLSHLSLQKPVCLKRNNLDFVTITSLYIHRCSLYYRFRTVFSCLPRRPEAVRRFWSCHFPA